MLACVGAIALAAAAHAADPPEMSPDVKSIPYDPKVFKQDPTYDDKPYDAQRQQDIYGGKKAVDTPRPVIEIGRPLYTEGPFRPSSVLLGEKNLIAPSLWLYGDWRTAVAYNDNGKKEDAQIATRLNLDVDLKLTATERVHAFFRPLDQGGQFTHYSFAGDDRSQGKFIKDGNLENLFFEGDLGAMAQGLTGEYNGVDLPVAAGLMPMLFQNGVWVDDAFTGFAFAIPARNSKFLDISNMDITYFMGLDKVSTAAIRDDKKQIADHNVQLYGVAAFVETLEGYFEVGYGYTRGEGIFDELSYHNATLAFTRRYGGFLSNSVRGIWNFGQNRRNNQQQTADGFILLVENSLITSKPLTLVPYFNFFAGFDRPQSLARDPGAGGVLKNTGINFETDGLTGFPKLDDTGQNTYGGAVGLQYLFNLDQQIVVEAAGLKVREGNFEAGRPARGDEFAIGVRYQIPVTNRWIFRADAIKAWRENDADFAGIRAEVRRKF
ncbi:MAG: hypothetical protein HY246_10280 [Proteobacteria bacterium]|nr:hypothetical protein [Pseudomonadota bacterium]